MNRALLIVNMGGPENVRDVPDYLRSIFLDPRIINLPSILRIPLAHLITGLRSKKVIERYKLIGGASPLKWRTSALALSILSILRDENHKYETVSFAFRYTAPTIREKMEALKSVGIDSITLFPLFPHYTGSMTGSIQAEAETAASDLDLELRTIPRWGMHPSVIQIQQEYLKAAIAETGNSARVIFVAHGIPMSQVNRGEDYPRQVEATVAAISEVLNKDIYRVLTYQSKVGPVKWTTPYLEDQLDRICQSKDPIVIMPLSFVSDCLETLFDLDIVAAAKIRNTGIEKFVRVPVFNDDTEFAEALASVACEWTID
ncbi:MAG: ferrochelatase [Calditrichaeota bacterium]|nr:ferrochelatase [Calditrichota bacterium]